MSYLCTYFTKYSTILQQAVIYDMDGIIIDSEPLWRRAMIHGFSEVEVILTEDDCRITTGMRITEVIKFWHRRTPFNHKTKEELEKLIVATLCDFIRSEGKAMTGLNQSLDFFKKNNFKIGLATSSSELLIKTVLEALSIENEFHHVQSAENLHFGKPHPEVYMLCSQHLNIDPKNCIAIEDSVNGIISAKAAGMKVIAVPEHQLKNDPRFSIADVKLNSLEEIDTFVLNQLKIF